MAFEPKTTVALRQSIADFPRTMAAEVELPLTDDKLRNWPKPAPTDTSKETTGR
jgi:hypothetical protein